MFQTFFMLLFFVFNQGTANPNSKQEAPKPQNVVVAKYDGVSPPNPALPKEIPPPGGKCTLLWPGFQLLASPGGSRFFFLFSVPFQLQTQELRENSILVYRLIAPNCVAWEKHAWRDLITRFFETPIEKVGFYRDEKGTKLFIDFLYKDAKATIRPKISNLNFMNYYLLILEFPK